MREVGDEKYLDPLSVRTDAVDSKFGWGRDEADVIKEVLNHAYHAEGGIWHGSEASEGAAIHLAKDVWCLKRHVERLRQQLAEKSERIGGLIRENQRLASIIEDNESWLSTLEE